MQEPELPKERTEQSEDVRDYADVSPFENVPRNVDRLRRQALDDALEEYLSENHGSAFFDNVRYEQIRHGQTVGGVALQEIMQGVDDALKTAYDAQPRRAGQRRRSREVILRGALDRIFRLDRERLAQSAGTTRLDRLSQAELPFEDYIRPFLSGTTPAEVRNGQRELHAFAQIHNVEVPATASREQVAEALRRVPSIRTGNFRIGGRTPLAILSDEPAAFSEQAESAPPNATEAERRSIGAAANPRTPAERNRALADYLEAARRLLYPHIRPGESNQDFWFRNIQWHEDRRQLEADRHLDDVMEDIANEHIVGAYSYIYFPGREGAEGTLRRHQLTVQGLLGRVDYVEGQGNQNPRTPEGALSYIRLARLQTEHDESQENNEMMRYMNIIENNMIRPFDENGNRRNVVLSDFVRFRQNGDTTEYHFVIPSMRNMGPRGSRLIAQRISDFLRVFFSRHEGARLRDGQPKYKYVHQRNEYDAAPLTSRIRPPLSNEELVRLGIGQNPHNHSVVLEMIVRLDLNPALDTSWRTAITAIRANAEQNARLIGR